MSHTRTFILATVLAVALANPVDVHIAALNELLDEKIEAHVERVTKAGFAAPVYKEVGVISEYSVENEAAFEVAFRADAIAAADASGIQAFGAARAPSGGKYIIWERYSVAASSPVTTSISHVQTARAAASSVAMEPIVFDLDPNLGYTSRLPSEHAVGSVIGFAACHFPSDTNVQKWLDITSSVATYFAGYERDGLIYTAGRALTGGPGTDAKGEATAVATGDLMFLASYKSIEASKAHDDGQVHKGLTDAYGANGLNGVNGVGGYSCQIWKSSSAPSFVVIDGGFWAK